MKQNAGATQMRRRSHSASSASNVTTTSPCPKSGALLATGSVKRATAAAPRTCRSGAGGSRARRTAASAAVKALSDVICTSSNAERIVRRIPADRPILFAPDQHLGRYVIKQTGRDMVLWPGACSVHVIFSERRLIRLKAEHPDALVLAHPECEERVLRLADHIGSTTSILNYATTSPARSFIVVTESGIIHQMKKACPDKEFIPAPPDSGCSCNECPYMRLNTLEKVYLCMRDRLPEISLPEDLRVKCLVPLQRMLELSA